MLGSGCWRDAGRGLTSVMFTSGTCLRAEAWLVDEKEWEDLRRVAL